MEEEPCRKKRLQVHFRRSKKKPTTHYVNGRCGWFYANANWTRTSRRSARRKLRQMVRHLNSRAAIRRIREENDR